ncbi:type IV secretory system conjugative DNA transfer family protein [Chitinophaga arvensicola]|uniref:type IV secretory system conjugative DNA transfer family protein n=1 Tax=Chitinophaga arvensicola TaxID=29529 RepID=UPI000A6C7A83|nr:type IV secretory system conjugative DNA transfer family protein [Chitinophaga arvensicola]
MSTCWAARFELGKSYYLVREVIKQNCQKGFSVFVYDFKYDDLTKIVYNELLRNKKAYKVPPKFCVINFDDLSYSHRCNPLDPQMMTDITDAAESSRSLLLGLNRSWVARGGDFFVESPINFITAVIWFLRRYKNGRFCTLPHVIEIISLGYESLFPMLGVFDELTSLVDPFIQAYCNNAREQLEGQIASAKIALARLSSPQLYYVLSGDDFSLDINNPDEPKVFCAGNNPLKIQTYGAVLSLYTNRMLKLVNRKGQLKCSLIFDEYPTIYCPLHVTVSTGRSNLIQTWIAVQSIEQVRMDYSKEQAEVLFSVCGNIISGQSVGDSAKIVSERIGKIVQERESVSINRTDTSVSRNTNLEYAVPQSKISNLTAGEFCGVVADNPTEPIELKAFNAQFVNDHKAIKDEQDSYVPLPKIRDVTEEEVMENYNQIKADIIEMEQDVMAMIKGDPNLAHLLFVHPDNK